MQVMVVLLTFVWLAMAVLGAVALIRGHIDWARITNRKRAGWLLAAAFVVLVVTGLLVPEQQPGDEDSEHPETSAPIPTSETTTAPISPTTSPQPMPPPSTDPPEAPPSPSTPSPAPRRPAPEPTAVPDIYYSNCAEARAAGAAPILRGQPGYRPELDANDDGIACEEE